MSSLPLQPLGGGDLRGDDSLRIPRCAAVDPCIVFRGRNERRHRVHVGGKDNRWIRLLRRSREHVGPFAFYGHYLGVVPEAAEMISEKNPDTAFVAGDGFNVDQLAS